MNGGFQAFRVFEENGHVAGRVVDATLEELGVGGIVIRASHSSVNYKDALAATGTGKIIRRFPLIAGVDVAGTVISSDDSRFPPGKAVLVTGFDLGVAHNGGYAGVVRVPADWVVAIPVGLTAFEAMAIGTAGFTAALSVVELERPDSGSRTGHRHRRHRRRWQPCRSNAERERLSGHGPHGERRGE